MFLQKYKDKQFLLGQNILKEGVILTQPYSIVKQECHHRQMRSIPLNHPFNNTVRNSNMLRHLVDHLQEV